MPQGVSYVHHAILYIRTSIPDSMSIAASAGLAYRGGAMPNFAFWAFSEVRIQRILRTSL
jgi:hypothetical protein